MKRLLGIIPLIWLLLFGLVEAQTAYPWKSPAAPANCEVVVRNFLHPPTPIHVILIPEKSPVATKTVFLLPLGQKGDEASLGVVPLGIHRLIIVYPPGYHKVILLWRLAPHCKDYSHELKKMVEFYDIEEL